jgi:hypothetical protein
LCERFHKEKKKKKKRSSYPLTHLPKKTLITRTRFGRNQPNPTQLNPTPNPPCTV